MGKSDPDTNWLHAEMVTCPHCQTRLYRVDRPPMYDEWQLYCDRCANRVEVSYYDPQADAISMELFGRRSPSNSEQRIELLREIEARLRPCSCGGQYLYDAPRRCAACLGVVFADEPGVDLWPEFFDIDVDERNPTAEEISEFERFDSTHIRRDDIWK